MVLLFDKCADLCINEFALYKLLHVQAGPSLTAWQTLSLHSSEQAPHALMRCVLQHSPSWTSLIK